MHIVGGFYFNNSYYRKKYYSNEGVFNIEGGCHPKLFGAISEKYSERIKSIK